MRRSRALLTLSMAAALVAGMATACGDSKDDGEIDVWIGFTDYRLDWAKKRAAEFEKAHPKYKINVNGYDSYEVLFDAVTAAAEQDETPTIVQNFEAATQESRDVVDPDGKPLFTSVEKAIDGRKKILDEPVVLNDIVDSARNYYTVDGEFSSMPWNTSTPVFFSNKSYMKKAGIDKPPATWEELKEDCDKVMDLPDAPKSCVTWPNHAWMPEQVLAEQGKLLADHKNGRDGRARNIDLTSDSWMSWLKYWKKLNDDGKYFYSGVQEDFEGTENAFGGEKVAFMGTSSGDGRVIMDSAKKSKFDVDVTRLPAYAGKKNHGNLIGGATLWLANGLKHTTQDGALAFMQYMNNPENAADWHKKTGYIPITNKSIDLLEKEGWYDKNPYQKVASEQLADSEESPAVAGVLVGSFVAIRAEVTQAMEDVLTSGADPDERFAKAQKRAQDLLDEYNSLYATESD